MADEISFDAGPAAHRRAGPEIVRTRQSFSTIWRQHWQLYTMLLPAAVLLILFRFYPLWGISLAFIDWEPMKGVLGSAFVGLDVYRRIFSTPDMGLIIRNTVVIAVGKIILVQSAGLAFALIIHQLGWSLFRRISQTLTTLPYFLSWIIVGGIMLQILPTRGVLNMGLREIGLGPIRFLTSPEVFPWTLIWSEVWKNLGFAAVIYLAALVGINPELYEAAAVDGAGRGARLLHVTLPGIAPTIVLMACLNLGNVLEAGFEQVLVLQNPAVYATGDILDTYVYRAGILSAQYSLATAVGLLKSVVGFVMVCLSYWLADRLANYRVF